MCTALFFYQGASDQAKSEDFIKSKSYYLLVLFNIVGPLMQTISFNELVSKFTKIVNATIAQ